MNPTGIILIFSIILGAALSGTGIYFIINNLVEPQGFLFEGIVMLSLGVITSLLVILASALGKTMITFGEIMAKQTAIQKKLNNAVAAPGSAPKPGGLSSLLSEMLKNGDKDSDISVQFLTNPVSKLDIFDEDSFDDKMSALKEKLSDAIKDDDYEKAKEINLKIKELKDSANDDDSSEDKKE